MKFLTSTRLVLTPLSPIHIGCGEEFEPTNYVIEDRVLYAFDPSRAELPDNLRKRLEVLGDKADLLGIQRFFREHRQHFMPHAHTLIPVAAGVANDYEEQIGQVANREANGNRIFNQLFIERASHTGIDQQPYIPGSSFKGALRTAKLDAINQGRRVTDADERRKSNLLEQRLLAGDFATSPLRLLKAGDFMPATELAQQVLYGLNRKKDSIPDGKGGERQPKGIAARKQCIVGGQYRALQSTLVVQQTNITAASDSAIFSDTSITQAYSEYDNLNIDLPAKYQMGIDYPLNYKWQLRGDYIQYRNETFTTLGTSVRLNDRLGLSADYDLHWKTYGLTMRYQQFVLGVRADHFSPSKMKAGGATMHLEFRF